MSFRVRIIVSLILFAVVMTVVTHNLKKFFPVLMAAREVPLSGVTQQAQFAEKGKNHSSKQKTLFTLLSSFNKSSKGSDTTGKPPVKDPIIPQKTISKLDACIDVRPPLSSITFLDEPLPNSRLNAKQLKNLSREFEKIQKSNQRTLQDLNNIFGKKVATDALRVVIKSEETLRKSINEVCKYEDFFELKREVLQNQESEIFKVIQKNSKSVITTGK